MNWQDSPPPYPFQDPTERVLVLEARRSPARTAALDAWAETASAAGARVWRVSADFQRGGIWAGLGQWLEELAPEISAGAPDLWSRYADALALILPRLRPQTERRLTLTDTAPPGEAVRNYALDRAYRIGHAVIDLLAEWHERSGGGAWVVVCEDLDRAGALSSRFFVELVRRRAERMSLTLVAAVDAGRGEPTAERFRAVARVAGARLDVPAEEAAPADPVGAGRLAEALEARVADDPIEMEIHLQELISLWLASDRPHRAYRWQVVALGLYNHNGFYEDAARFVDPVVAGLDQVDAHATRYSRWDVVGNVFGALIATRQVDRAAQVLREEAVDKIRAPGDRVRILYALAMLHSRFHPQPDFALAEDYIHQAVDEMANAEMPEGDRHFLHVFLNNGLAFIRHRQGRAEEAAALTSSGFERLEANLSEERHRLHRSVLLYNTGQVHAATGRHQDAIDAFAAAIEMDPYYSEYYNERGNIYLGMGRFDDAIRDYRQAIEYSAPYPEVWINLGQCFRAMRRPADAEEAFSVALDLDPSRALARVGRAQVRAALGRTEDALADYDLLLREQPDSAPLRANRAVLRYTAGRVADALADLDRAVELAPDLPDLYANRATALAELGRGDDAARDLERYLLLAPAAPDAEEVRARLAALRPARMPAPAAAAS